MEAMVNVHKILITGHSGFKGSWLSKFLHMQGHEVVGLSNDLTGYKLWKDLDLPIEQFECDILDLDALRRTILKIKPDLVVHFAAQPLVSESHFNPIQTLQSNIIGTANLLESLRNSNVKSVVLATTDKVYKNYNKNIPFKENDELGGTDIYSISKAAMELVVEGYYTNFFMQSDVALATVRSGNVIGGGDYSAQRIVPDLIRASQTNEKLILRNPQSTRPWLHVVEPILGYLKVLYRGLDYKDFTSWNFGPCQSESKTVMDVVVEAKKIIDFEFFVDENTEFKEAKLLSLDSNKAMKELGWTQKLSFEETISYTIDWYKRAQNGDDINLVTEQQLNEIACRH